MPEAGEDRKVANHRNSALEWAKLVAMIAIAFQHTVENDVLRPVVTVTHFAVPSFVLISVWFAFQAGLRESTGKALLTYIRKRTLKIYGLFLLWNGFVFLMRLINETFVSKSGSFSATWDGFLLSGFGNALWFLPFIFFANVAALVCGFVAAKSRIVLWTLVLACLVGGGLLAVSQEFPQFRCSVYFFQVATKAVPTVLFAIALASWCSIFNISVPRAVLLTLSLLVFAVAAWGILEYQRSSYLWETLMGFGFVGVFLSLNAAGFAPLRPELSLWIYLAHAPVIQVTKDLLPKFGLSWSSSSPAVELLAFGIFIAVLIAVFRIGMTRFRKLLSLLLLTPITKRDPADS